MKIFEVGFICMFEGGHGYTVGFEGEELDLELAKAVLIYDINCEINKWMDIIVDDPSYQNYLDDYSAAKVEVEKAETLDDLRKVTVEAHSLVVTLQERRIMTIEDFK